MAKSIIYDLIQIFKSSVSAVLPENLIQKSMKYNTVSQQLTIVNEKYNLKNKNVYLVGTGKAVQNMAKEVENILSSKIKHGIISIPVGSVSTTTSNNVYYYEGAKDNLPDNNAESTARKIKELAIKLNIDDVLIVLISGGGSALLPLPREPITLEEKTLLIRKLANAGADIKELNTVRKRLSDLKGGQLANKGQPAHIISLILSDIVGDPLDLIASGPTSENKDDYTKAINIIKSYNLYNELPISIKTVLKDTDHINNFPKNKVSNHIIGSNTLAIAAASNEVKNLKYVPIELSNTVTGDICDIAKEYIELVIIFCNFLAKKTDLETLKLQLNCINVPGINTNVLNASINGQDLCLILGGEITVKVKGTGKGGRNQQLALEFSKLINEIRDDLEDFDVYFLSAGTDGIDGPTNAAGAIGYKNLVSESKLDNHNINEYLVANDSYNFYKKFKKGNLHIITGHTNTNVMDIHLIIIKNNNQLS